MVDNIEACRKYYLAKSQNKSVENVFSKYGDIAQIDNETYVDCNRNLLGMQQFHTIHANERSRRLHQLRLMKLHNITENAT